MAYNNRIPNISRIAQTVRDKDFIPITELKEFDAKLDEIIEKFSAVNNDTVSSQASNIGDLIKQIEYNMSDAIEFNPDGSIAGFKDVIDETSGATIPVNGENSYLNLTDKLEEYYNEFMKLFGNDENAENWKNELTQYKEKAINAFKNRINGIFGRIAEQNAVESKEDEKDDYITSDPVKIKNNQIMRLNPDKHSFTRQITIMPQGANKDVIAFEVGELEEKSLVLNMKVQNAKMFYNFNIVIDNGEVHITKEEHIKLSDHTVNFKIHRYMSGSGKYMYVFVMNTDDPSTNVTYIIELTGILINGYSFGSSGQDPLDHKYYYAYYQVDNTSKPDYNEKYYVKSYDTSQVGLKTNYITYTVVTDTVPKEGETYYTSYTKDDGTVVYKEQKLLTQFEEGVVYYTRSVTTKSEGEAVENQYVMIEYTNLREFDPDKEYFVKREEWKLIKEFAIESDTTSGIVDPTDKDIDNNTLFDDCNQVVVDGIKFADTLKYKNVDVECEELLGITSDAEKAIKGKEIVRLDDGVRFYKPYPGMISKVRRGAKKIDGKLAISLGSKVADLFEIQPGQAIVSTPIVEESIVDKTKDLIDLDLQLNEDDIYAADILEGKVNFYAFLKQLSTDSYIESFGQTIHDEVLFVNYFNIKFIGTIGDILDFQICADGNENYETCQHIFYNNKEKKVIFPVLRETADQLNTVINVKKRWKMLVSNQTYLFALSYDKEVWYSIDGGYHFKKHRKATKLGLVDIITDKKNFMGVTEDGKTYFTTNGFDSYTQITFDSEEISPNRKDDDKIISLGEDLWYYIEDHKILELNREVSCWDVLWESENEYILKNIDFKTKGTQIDSNITELDDPYFVFVTKNIERNSICFNKYNMSEKKFVKLIDYFDSKMNFDRIVTYQLLITGSETKDVLLVNIFDETDVNYTLNVVRFLYTNNTEEYITESNSDLIFIKTKSIEKINSSDKFVNNVYQDKNLIVQPFGTHTKGFSTIKVENNVKKILWVAGSIDTGLYYSTDGKTWTQSNITDGYFRTVYYDNGIWIAGSNSGKGLYYSTDGKTWTQSNITSGNFSTVYYDNGIWVAGNNGNKGLYYSEDGKTWTQSNITTGYFYIVYHNGSIWVAGNNSGKGLYYSEDGKTWTQSNITSGSFFTVYYDNGIWVAGSSDIGDKGLYYSEDGKTWTQSNITSGSFFTVYYDNGIWIAGSDIGNGLYYSTDGKTWTQSNITSGSFFTVYYDNGIWIAGSIGKGLYYSEDGKTWTQSNISSGDFFTVYYDNGIWVAGSNNDKGLYYSTDGKTWTQSNITSGNFITVYHNKINDDNVGLIIKYQDIISSIWVAGASSDDGLYYSTDGKTWTQSNISSGDFFTVYYDNGIWIAGSGNSDKGLYYSEDGKTWTQSNITSGRFRTVYYDNGIWVAGNNRDKGLYYSTDGKTWTQSNITSGRFTTVYYDNGIWVAGSEINKGLYYSTDGKTWTQSNITDGYFTTVYYDNGIWVAGNNTDKGLYYSEDGKTWTQSNITSGRFATVYYDNGIWVAGSESNKGLYYSTDGKTWTQSNITDGFFTTVYYNNGIWVAGAYNNNNGLYYSEDGKTWTQSNITSGYFITVYYDNGIWVAGSYSDKGFYYSTDGKTWTQSNISSGDFFTVYHNGFISLSINSINGENGLLFDGNFIPNLKVLYSKNIRLEIGDKKLTATNPLNDTTFETTEYPLNPDKISEIYDKSKLFVRTISDVGVSESEDEYNNQSEKEMIAFINPTIEAPIFIISKRELQSQFVVHNSILSIKDIVERCINDMIVADSYDGSLQYDELSGLYTKNIVDNNDIMQYASTSEGVFAYGSGKGQTYIVDWLNSRIKTFEDLEVDGILECGVDKSIYVFPSNSNGVFKYDKVNKVIDRENIFPSLNDVNCEYGFETSDGLFIVGVKSTTNLDGEDIEKSVIYFSPNKFDPETFSVGGPASTEEQRVFKEILVTDVIDFCKPFGDEIVISTYDIDNPNVKYRFDRVSQTFKSVSVIDINHIYSFSYAEMYDGKIFVLNGTGSNPDVKCGFGVLNKTIYDASSVGDDDRFYDIEILTPIDNINESESPSLFVHGGDLFGIVIETNDEGKSECVVYAYIPQVNSFVKMTSENSPLISAITSVANEEIKDIDENGHNIGYSASVQETADKTVEVIKNYDFALENENYQIDKFYFDKENEGIILGNYTNGNNAFRIESNCMTFVTTESGNKSQIAIALPKENYIAVFDKSLRSLKTVSLRYKAIVNTTYHYVDVDTSRFTIKGIFGASDLDNNYLYILIYGKFPVLNQNGSNVTESQVSDDSYRLFRTTIDELLNTNTTGVLYELSTTAHTITDIENYIKSQNLTLSDSIDYDVRNNYQLIGMKRDLLYKNIDSIAFWNTNSGSLDIISPLLWNNDIESDVNISGKNKEETYKDFIVFGDRNDKLYSFDAKSSVLREITKTGVESYAPIYRRGKTNFIGSSTSLNKIKNIEENPNINGCIDSIEFESIKDIEEKVNSSFATKKGLFASSYNNDDDVSYDKFKIVKSDNNIQKNLLTSNNSYKFQRVIDTRFGLFRWCITDSILSVDSRYNKYSVPAYYRYCYFNPNNKSKTITINPGNRSVIYGIWETLEGLFIGIKDYEYVSPDTIETFKLYYMKLIPNDIKLDFISINDERYFEEVDCNHMEVFDMKNTRYGLMIAAGGIGGNNGTNPTTDSNVSDSQLVEPPLGCIMLWNGETFITVDSDFTFNDVINGIYYPINIFDTSIGLFALCLKSVYDAEQKTYDKFSEALYQYDNESESFVLYSEIGEIKNKYVYLNKIFGSCTNRVFIETDIGPVYRSLSGIYDIKRKRIIKNIDDTNIESISIVRKYYESPDIYKSRNLYKIANHLHSRYNLPLDHFMKVFGSIMYNGLQVPVSALKIISRPGNNTEPFTVSFTIDKDARFTRNIDTIKAFLEKKSEEGVLSSINIGEITDWDIEKQKYIDHPINISKINIVVISDGITDERELEIEANYDFIMEQITDLKRQIDELIDQRSIIGEGSNTLHANIERSIDAKATSDRNLAVNLGFNINEDGCPLPKDGSEDLIKGFTEFITAIRECEANDDYSKIYIGDYFVIPDFDGFVERFDVIGVNTYNVDGNNPGLLVQSHNALGDGTTAWSDVIKRYQTIVSDFETMYNVELRPVKRWLGINTYTETSRLSAVKEAVALISENNTPSNNKFWTQKMFNLAEEEVGHPMNTNCDANSHSSCVIPLYARAPQYRVKRDHDGNPRHCWTDTFCAVDSSTHEGTVLNQQTTGRCIVYGDRNIIVNDLGVSERAMVTGDTYAMDPYYSPCMYI